METKVIISIDEYKLCEDFATISSKTQRENRSGGTIIRPIASIKIDTLRGKVGELIVKKFLEQEPFCITNIKLDFSIYPRGIWDQQDFILKDKRISVKSAKWFSKWLLLEKKDIDREDLFDYYVLVTVDKDFKGGTVKGYATKEEIISDKNTLFLKKGDYIPGTRCPLDADNYGRICGHLHNSSEDWLKLLFS